MPNSACSLTASLDLAKGGLLRPFMEKCWGQMKSTPLAKFAKASLGGAVASLALGLVDGREVLGANTWLKPAKFFFSTAIYAGTLSRATRYVEARRLESKTGTYVVWGTISAAIVELGIISARAALAQESHFNVTSSLDSFLYGVMANGALILVSTSAVLGAKLWRSNVIDGAQKVGWTSGLILAGSFGALTGLVMGSGTGHMVSQGVRVATSTATIPFLGWATDIGDLRVAHFAALHAMFVLPAVSYFASRWCTDRTATKVTQAGTLVWAAIVVGALARAIGGQGI